MFWLDHKIAVFIHTRATLLDEWHESLLQTPFAEINKLVDTLNSPKVLQCPRRGCWQESQVVEVESWSPGGRLGQYPSRRTSPRYILGNIALFDVHIDCDVRLRITKTHHNHQITATKRLRQNSYTSPLLPRETLSQAYQRVGGLLEGGTWIGNLHWQWFEKLSFWLTRWPKNYLRHRWVGVFLPCEWYSLEFLMLLWKNLAKTWKDWSTFYPIVKS